MSATPDPLDRRGVAWGLVGVAVVIALTLIGSDRLAWFDAALVGYLFGLLFAVFGVVYRYSVWLRRPPTATLNRRGWDAFRRHKARNVAALPSLVATQLLGQGFIRRRSRSRWLAHQLVFWGCVLAALVTFPLTLGILHFESVGQQADRYRVYLSRVGTVQFDAGSIVGWVTFHLLDFAAVLVLAGVFIFLRRRLRDPGALVSALAERAFELLYEGIEKLPETDDPAADLVAIGTYVVRRLVRDHPALYRIAFQRIAGLHAEPGLVAARERAWAQLNQRVARLEGAGLSADKSVSDAARELNAMWEGLANAELRGDVLRIMPRGQEERAWHDALTTVVRGLTTTSDGAAPPNRRRETNA